MAKRYTPQLWDIITLKDGTIINIDTEEKLKVVAEKVKANYKWFKENTESIRNEPIKISTQDTTWISMNSEVENKPLSAKDKAKELMNERESKIKLQKEYANAKLQVEDIYSWTKNRWITFWDRLVDQNKQILLYNDNKKAIDEFNNQIKLNIEEEKKVAEEIRLAKDAAKKARAEKKLAKLAEEKNTLIENAKKLTDEHLKKYWSVLDNNVDIDKERIKKSLEDIDKFNKNINQNTTWISMDSEQSPKIKLRKKPLQSAVIDSEVPKDIEFEKFVKEWKVSNGRIEDIVNKIKTWAKLTKEDLSIRNWYVETIEDLLKWKKVDPKVFSSTVDDVVQSVDRKAPKISLKDIKMSWVVDDTVDATKKWASSLDDIQPVKQTIWEILWGDKSKIKTFLQQNPKIAGILKWEWGKTLKLLSETSPKTAALLKFWSKTIIPLTVAYNALKDLEVQNEWKYDWSWNILSDIASRWKMLGQWAADAWVNLAVNLWADAIKFWDLVWKWIAWTLWQAWDIGKNLTYFWASDETRKQMDKNNIDYSDKFTDAWDSLWVSNKWDSYANNTKALGKELIYWNWDWSVYNRTLDKYNNNSWVDREWNTLWISLDSEYKQPAITTSSTTTSQPQSNIVVPTSDTNQWTQQWRRLFKLKDGTFWYLSQWWENEWKIVRWFKTLDEAKNAVNQWVKWFHLWNIKNELNKVNTKDKSVVENVLTKYIKEKWINPSNAKDKWITDEWLKEIWISF